MVFKGFLHFPDSSKMLPQIGKMSQDGPSANFAPMIAQVGLFGASWAILAAFWRPLGHHFASRVFSRRPGCRQDLQNQPSNTDFSRIGASISLLFQACFLYFPYAFFVSPPAPLPQLSRFSLMCSLSKSGAGGRGEALR